MTVTVTARAESERVQIQPRTSPSACQCQRDTVTLTARGRAAVSQREAGGGGVTRHDVTVGSRSVTVSLQPVTDRDILQVVCGSARSHSQSLRCPEEGVE